MRSVLLTGGSGYFSRAFVRELLKQPIRENVLEGESTGPERICIYSRGEHAQALMRQEFNDDPRLRFLIGDVRDPDRLRLAMRCCDVVIHAAALKRIEVGAGNPTEMCLTNVMGTMNVVKAADEAGVERVVALSSDKAYQPVSPYGQSKALAETIVLAANKERAGSGTRYSSVRYGNVSGSTGSVIPLWRAPLPMPKKITDPECTRFWMTANEAVQLVLTALQAMPEHVLVPELPAYRLGDLAEAMGLIDPEVVGLPSHEKLHESMADGNCSDTARRMSVEELREALKGV